MKIAVINGPNLNMLGMREAGHYGTGTLTELMDSLRKSHPSYEFLFFQSNHEGELVDFIQKRAIENDIQAVIANFGGLTHTSVSIRDALALLHLPKIEVHLSNIHAREEFRHTSRTAGACNGVIAGFGFQSYHLAVNAVEGLVGGDA